MIEFVPPELALQKAMGIVRDAQHLLRVTHKLGANQIGLPLEYQELIVRRLEDGITLKRIACGTLDQFESFQRESMIDHKNYICKRAGIDMYQRMLLVDDNKMMFAIEKKNLHATFYTDDPNIIRVFADYFDKLFLLSNGLL